MQHIRIIRCFRLIKCYVICLDKSEECSEISKSEADTNFEEDMTSYLEELPSPSEGLLYTNASELYIKS